MILDAALHQLFRDACAASPPLGALLGAVAAGEVFTASGVRVLVAAGFALPLPEFPPVAFAAEQPATSARPAASAATFALLLFLSRLNVVG